jgi:sugar porter (SP) family MFS transporter
MESPNSPRGVVHKSANYEQLETSPSDQPLENKGYLIYLTLIGSLGGVLLGYDLSIIGVASLYMYNGDPIDDPGDSITALVTSVAILGCAVGSISGGIMGDKYGRKKTIMIADFFMIVGELLLTFALHLGMLFAGRLIVGLGVGMLCTTCPNYLSEAAPDSHRGLIAGSNAFFITASQLLTLFIGVIFQEQWRFMFGFGLIFSVGQLVGFTFLPESPKWLFKMNREKEAEEALARIRLPKHKRDISVLQEEIRAIKLSTANDINEPYFTQLKSLFANCKKQVKVGALLQIFQQFTGINIAMYYGPTIVKESVAGGNKVLGMLLTIPIFATNSIGSGIGVKILDKAGRRSLLLWTIPGIIAGLVILCILFGIQLAGSSSTISILIIVGVIIYVGFFGLAMGPIPWTINAEIYPTQYTSVASSVAATSNWVTNAIITQIFGTINTIPICSVLVWVVAAFLTTACWFFVYLGVPETKGKSQAEIQALFGSKKTGHEPLI